MRCARPTYVYHVVIIITIIIIIPRESENLRECCVNENVSCFTTREFFFCGEREILSILNFYKRKECREGKRRVKHKRVQFLMFMHSREVVFSTAFFSNCTSRVILRMLQVGSPWSPATAAPEMPECTEESALWCAPGCRRFYSQNH